LKFREFEELLIGQLKTRVIDPHVMKLLINYSISKEYPKETLEKLIDGSKMIINSKGIEKASNLAIRNSFLILINHESTDLNYINLYLNFCFSLTDYQQCLIIYEKYLSGTTSGVCFESFINCALVSFSLVMLETTVECLHSIHKNLILSQRQQQYISEFVKLINKDQLFGGNVKQ
ncbi:MAG: hypothetical protein MHMPM18_004559, partial [Marteilia pararefringens]